MSKAVLVTGATGTQGGGLIDAMLASPRISEFTLFAVTRDATSKKARSILNKSSHIKLVQGDLDNIPALFDAAVSKNDARPIWGVFSVQTFFGGGASVESEERQGKALVDEALRHHVSCFVYSSVERGGDAKSWTDPTNVPHFISKHRIELHLRDSTARSKVPMQWTILRPTTFYENITTDYFLRIFATSWKMVVREKPLQLIAGSDIGWFAAQAFLDPQAWSNKALGLAGDELTWSQFKRVFETVTDRPLPLTFNILCRVLLWFLKDISLMFKWFGQVGAKADIQALRRMNPDLMSVETWLRSERSGHQAKKA